MLMRVLLFKHETLLDLNGSSEKPGGIGNRSTRYLSDDSRKLDQRTVCAFRDFAMFWNL